jgi:thiosulfate dehydrogenase
MRSTAILLVLAAVGACSGPAKTLSTSPASNAVTPLSDSAFPPTPFGAAARRGRAILAATRDSLPGHVGNGLRCTTCHLDDGRRPYAMPWLGVHARYPQYRSRAARVLTVEDRINECLERSLAGKALPPEDERLRAIEAYFAFISRGIPVGEPTLGQGIDSVKADTAHVDAGERLFGERCARCHGADGDGTDLATPLWGNRAYTIAAGMARTRMAAGFIRHNMPFDQPGTLTDQEALDVAAYINSRPRPDYAGKSGDWPRGGAPPDVPYTTGGDPKTRATISSQD